MQIEVVAEDAIGPQARVYAEYRLFATLSRIVDTGMVRHAQIVLRQVGRDSGGESILCSITVDTEGADPVTAHGSGHHPYAAINVAVDKLGGPGTP